jgi:hypothetical protein
MICSCLIGSKPAAAEFIISPQVAGKVCVNFYLIKVGWLYWEGVALFIEKVISFTGFQQKFITGDYQVYRHNSTFRIIRKTQL